MHRQRTMLLCEQCSTPFPLKRSAKEGSRFCSRDCWRQSFEPTARFLSKVSKQGPIPEHCRELGPCWVWTAAISTNGYGAFDLDRRQERAHVVAYRWWVGEIPADLSVLHRCDRKSCVNPCHLYAGTKLDNARDAVERGQYRRGTGNGRAKLTEPEVIRVRELAAQGVALRALSRMCKVSVPAIKAIVTRETWKHVI